MLTYTGTSTVSFGVPATGAAFTPADDLIFVPEPGQRLGSLALIIADPGYDFSGAVWASDDPGISFDPPQGAEVAVVLDATGFDAGDYEDFAVSYRVDF